MEHSLEIASPWRTRALVAAAVAAAELVVLLIVATAFLGQTVAHDVRQAAETRALAPPPVHHAKPRKTAAPRPILSRGETSVLVLNGNGRPGAAADEAAVVRRLGYVIGSVGDAPRTDYTRTLVMYRGRFRPEALRLARDLHGALVGPLDGIRASDLMGAHLALVVGS